MKTQTKDFIHARGMNSDVETIEMLMRKADGITQANQIYEGAYRICFGPNDSTVINDDEMKWLREYVQDHTEIDFTIYMLDGGITLAVV